MNLACYLNKLLLKQCCLFSVFQTTFKLICLEIMHVFPNIIYSHISSILIKTTNITKVNFSFSFLFNYFMNIKMQKEKAKYMVCSSTFHFSHLKFYESINERQKSHSNNRNFRINLLRTGNKYI